MSDPRFARLHTDPRFVRPKANKHKVVVDERFKQLFDGTAGASGKGQRARKVDKYGRPLAKEASVNELKRYYRLASPEAEALKKGEAAADEAQEGEEDEEDEESSEDEEEEGGKAAPAGGFMDLARGEGLLESSDEEEEGSDDEALASDAESTSSSAAGAVTLGGRAARRRVSRSPSIDLSETEYTAFPDEDDEEEQEEDEEPDAEPTRRIALVNLDWDHLRASDLYRVLSSCISSTASSSSTLQKKPPAKGKVKFDADGNEVEEYAPSAKLSIAKGRLLSLRIYPSQFGRERMEREAIEGPPVAVLKAKGAESDEEDEGELKLGAGKKKKGKGKGKKRGGEESEDEFTQQDLLDEQLQDGEEDYDTEALRQYQLERLRYYYAVATFDTVSAAEHVFQEIHGSEFERTANIFDLQFIPDETSFDDDPVHDEATEASIAAEGNSYTGLDFSTDALRHSKVKLTWDADDPHRKNKMQTYLAAHLDRSKQKGATKGKAAVGDADIEQYLASSSGEEDDAAEEEEEEADDFFEAPAEEEAPKGKKGKKESKRDRMRALLGLGDGGAAEDDLSWDGGKKEKKGGDGGMQITFAPALSERSAKQLEFAGEEKQETSLERYKRKEKERKERKKAERKARAEGRLDDDEGEFSPGPSGAVGEGADDLGFDDDFFADDGADPFAAYDAGAGDSGDEIGLKKSSKKQSKKDQRAQREAEDAANAKEQAELALLVGSDDEDDVLGAGGEGGRHFDMRQILKAEKAGGKKVKGKGKGKGKKALAKEEAEKKVNDEFKIDVKDDRFKSLHEDFDFAIDPSNPRYQKSRNMEALLAEGRKRRSTKTSKARAPVAPVDGKAPAKRSLDAAGGAEGGESLSKLVEAVKRKAGETGGRGKRAKTG